MNDNYKIKVGTKLSQNRPDVHTRPSSKISSKHLVANPLYKTTEEKAAHLLYFIIKDHPFMDGNKRIGSFTFLFYLRLQNVPIKLDENGLVALALLIAESNPAQKEIMIRLIVNILID